MEYTGTDRRTRIRDTPTVAGATASSPADTTPDRGPDADPDADSNLSADGYPDAPATMSLDTTDNAVNWILALSGWALCIYALWQAGLHAAPPLDSKDS